MTTSQKVQTYEGRQRIAQNTLHQTKSIIEEHANEGATEDSLFYAEQLPTLPALPETEAKHLVEVVNGDSFTAARKLMDEHSDSKGSIAVLNLASDEIPGGGWLVSLTKTQVRGFVRGFWPRPGA